MRHIETQNGYDSIECQSKRVEHAEAIVIADSALKRVRERASRLNLARFDWQTLKADRDTGRP